MGLCGGAIRISVDLMLVPLRRFVSLVSVNGGQGSLEPDAQRPLVSRTESFRSFPALQSSPLQNQLAL